MKNILYAIRQGKTGGGERHLLDLVTHLNKSEYNPVVLSFTSGEMIGALHELNIKTYVIPTQRPYDLRIWPKITELIKQENIDIIHAHGSRACSNVFWSAKKLGIPFCYTVHGWSFHAGQQILVRTLRQTAERWLTYQADKVVNVSESNYKEGKERFGLRNSIMIQNGVDVTRFNNQCSFINIRSELGIPASSTLVGYIARITEQKDPLTFIRAAQLALKKHQDIHFLVVGEGTLKQETVSLAGKLGLLSNIHFQDFRTDVPDLLQAIDIYCLPSLWEGLPIGLLEAMAMGKAVIATPVDGTKEIVMHRDTGLFTNVKDPNDLAAKIGELHKKKELRAHLGYQASQLVKHRYNLLRTIQLTEEVYHEVLEKALKNQVIA